MTVFTQIDDAQRRRKALLKAIDFNGKRAAACRRLAKKTNKRYMRIYHYECAAKYSRLRDAARSSIRDLDRRLKALDYFYFSI